MCSSRTICLGPTTSLEYAARQDRFWVSCTSNFILTLLLSLKQLYLSLVHPHLEYAAQLWDPYAQRDICKLGSVQKFALKLVTHQWDSSYDELLSLVNVPKLSVRRQNLKLAQVFKIVHGLCYFPENIFRMQPSHSSRLSRTDTIYCPFAPTITTTL